MNSPRSRPYRRKLSAAYSEQLGAKRQLGLSSGDMNSLYAPINNNSTTTSPRSSSLMGHRRIENNRPVVLPEPVTGRAVSWTWELSHELFKLSP